MFRECHHLTMHREHHWTHIRHWNSLLPQTWWSPVAVWMKACLKTNWSSVQRTRTTSNTTTAWEIYTMLCLNIIITKSTNKQSEQYLSLGGVISADKRILQKRKGWIGQAKSGLHKMKNILINTYHLRLQKILWCWIAHVLMYGCKAWAVIKQKWNH